jgi:hypothetical protein
LIHDFKSHRKKSRSERPDFRAEFPARGLRWRNFRGLLKNQATTHHNTEIVDRIFKKGEDFSTVCLYLQALEATYQSDQSYLAQQVGYIILQMNGSQRNKFKGFLCNDLPQNGQIK